MKTLFIRFGLLLFLLMGTVAVRAEDLGAVKSRMTQRQSTLDSLRKDGAIGEDNRGFTSVRKAGGNAAAVSAAENRDREIVYAEIAKQAGTDASQVGKARARQIASTSTAGVWLQNESGEWYQK